MRTVIVRAGAWLACVWIPAAVQGFEWYEHRPLTNAAFLAARHGLPESAMTPKMRAAVDARLKGPVTLGDITLAVDWVKKPEVLLNPETVNGKFASRRGNFVMKGLAAHHNAHHFQIEALERWKTYHTQAIKLAHDNAPAAVVAEAVALHFLQDFFAAGHVVTPRHGMHDAAAGQLHDHFNWRGVSFALANEQPPEVEKVLRWLVEQKLLTEDDHLAYEAAARQPVTFYGDRLLFANCEQEAFVMIVSTLSVQEVLLASVQPPEASMQACFATRVLASPATSKELAKLDGPDGAIRIAKANSPVLSSCSDKTSWLGHYGTRDDRDLHRPLYDLHGLSVRSTVGLGRRTRDLRFDQEVLYLANAADPPGGVRDKEGKPSSVANGFLTTAGLTYSHATRFNALGALVDDTRTTHSDLISWGWRVALRRYDYGTGDAWRGDFGGKIAIGFQVINVVFAVDRMHTMSESRKFAHDYFASLGGDITLSASWLPKWLSASWLRKWRKK